MIHQGDALSVLKGFAPESIDCCITSPPYWALRDYKVEGQLGLEKTFSEYIDKLCEIFQEVKHVLKKTGTCWVVLGDTYSQGNKISNRYGLSNSAFVGREKHKQNDHYSRVVIQDISDKSLCMIPERFAIKMIDNGWILRNKIIWYKPNCMPSSAKDRFTVDWEYVFFFTKSQKYFFETQYESFSDDPIKRNRSGRHSFQCIASPTDKRGLQEMPPLNVALGRIKRCVWKISTKPFSGAHFAVFPETLIEPMIKAGCPEQICSKCGVARKIVYEEKRINTRPGNDVLNAKSGHEGDPNESLHTSDLSKYRQQIVRMPKFGGNRAPLYGNKTYSGNEWNPSLKVIKYEPFKGKWFDTDKQSPGYRAQSNLRRMRDITGQHEPDWNFNKHPVMTSCNCGAPFFPGTVLDPFCGAGTTGLVALKNARQFIGIELNPNYIKIAQERIRPYMEQCRLEV